MFFKMPTDLDNSVKMNIQDIKIGEYIFKEISLIEANFYKMGITTKTRLQKILKEIQMKFKIFKCN